MKKIYFLLSFIYAGTFTLFGCTGSIGTSQQASDTKYTTQTHLPFHSITQKPTHTSVPTTTLTQIPTRTQSPTPKPTSTPLLTLSPEDALEMVTSLFEPNFECQFPCWGTISPGKTTLEEVHAFFATIAADIQEFRQDVYRITFNVPETVNPEGVTGVTIYVQDNLVYMIRSWQDISLSELLLTYGEPTQIQIFAISSYTLDPEARFTIVLFYPEQGILAAYDGNANKNQLLQICPNNIRPGAGLVLWTPEIDMSFSEAGDILPLGDQLYYHPLDEATNMDISTFYKTYSNPDNINICFEMPDPDL